MSDQRNSTRKVAAVSAKLALIAVAVLVQLVVLLAALIYLSELSPWIMGIQLAISAVALVIVANSHMPPEYKLPWTVVILIVPLVGGMLYILFGRAAQNLSVRRRAKPALTQAEREYRDLDAAFGVDSSGARPGSSRHLTSAGGYPAFRDSRVTYYPLGDDVLQPMLDAIDEASEYIFFEYYIIAAGSMWSEVRAALARKASQGVIVRVLYDDMGSAFGLPPNFARDLRADGIDVHAVNPLGPKLGLLFNSRNHRKILVVDGRVAFTGGFNVADEYVNRIERFGHWKDVGVRIEGPAAWSFAVMFLTLWDVVDEPDEWSSFRPTPRALGRSSETDERGLVQPFAHSPFERASLGAEAYLNVIESAQRTLDISTPYLVLDFRTQSALTRAAQRGVRVRIVTPGIPDKRAVFETTRSFYRDLFEAGVEIYEYTPGFNHAKLCVADSKQAIVGTINFDYRSFYLNQECGVWLYDVPAIEDIAADIEATIQQSARVGERLALDTAWPRRALRSLLRLAAPLM